VPFAVFCVLTTDCQNRLRVFIPRGVVCPRVLPRAECRLGSVCGVRIRLLRCGRLLQQYAIYLRVVYTRGRAVQDTSRPCGIGACEGWGSDPA